MQRRAASVMCLIATLCACTQFPDLDGALSEGARDAPYPSLLPVEELNAQVTAARITPDTASGMQARVAALRARAARLHDTIIDSPTRQRMQAGVDEI